MAQETSNTNSDIKWFGLKNCSIDKIRLKCHLRSVYSCFYLEKILIVKVFFINRNVIRLLLDCVSGQLTEIICKKMLNIWHFQPSKGVIIVCKIYQIHIKVLNRLDINCTKPRNLALSSLKIKVRQSGHYLWLLLFHDTVIIALIWPLWPILIKPLTYTLPGETQGLLIIYWRISYESAC